MILVSPEQLQSSAFEGVLKDKLFMGRITILGVDEVHLLIVKCFAKHMSKLDGCVRGSSSTFQSLA
jgi:hypothetical protein